MKYILIYDNPERDFVIGLRFDTYDEAWHKMTQLISKGFDRDWLHIVLSDSEIAKWLEANKAVF